MAEYTRQTPDKRVESLKRFSQRINETPEIKQLLSDWNLQFSEALEKFNARILTPIEIVGGGRSTAKYQEENADWGNAFRKWTCLSTAQCGKWAVIYPPRDEAPAKDFISSLIKVRLGF